MPLRGPVKLGPGFDVSPRYHLSLPKLNEYSTESTNTVMIHTLSLNRKASDCHFLSLASRAKLLFARVPDILDSAVPDGRSRVSFSSRVLRLPANSAFSGN